MNWTNELPAPLLPFIDRFLATERACIRLQIKDTAPSHRWQSAIGSLQYWPVAETWPVDENGRPLFGLIQLNLAELPPLEPFPSHGILQFFVTDDAFWGANPIAPHRQDNFRVIYHDDPDPASTPLVEDFSFLPAFEDLPLQRDLCLAIAGQTGTMLLPPDDYRFDEELGDIFHDLGDEKWEVLRAYRKAIGTVGHRLGGYAAFAQEDPRSENDDDTLELLLQLDTDPAIGLLWGDYGVAHWLYKSIPELLSTIDFNQIWYGWESN
ncbi:YwqG family protein [Lewinella cohaerens]|uniref:YwqG family protein n=1 Tax=Lewinella cohaerens TaxID=70995 RepID=UPI00038050B5|nr:DUF1963 domain-containing protein [Lewinella cohaerens]